MAKMGNKPGRRRRDEDGNLDVVGEHMNAGQIGGSRYAELVYKERAPGYWLGELEHARDAFVAQTRLKIKWKG